VSAYARHLTHAASELTFILNSTRLLPSRKWQELSNQAAAIVPSGHFLRVERPQQVNRRALRIGLEPAIVITAGMITGMRSCTGLCGIEDLCQGAPRLEFSTGCTAKRELKGEGHAGPFLGCC
jgi:hypothetical protein